jgi:antitoxin (DNA-binding transcriptional repressor) of toxin-antitoxin stability system
MEQIGMRELRHRLRYYLARVGGGERFEVTLFGRPVASLGPLPSALTSFDRLVEEGKITPALNGDTSRLPTPFPITTGVSATAALLDERRSDAR